MRVKLRHLVEQRLVGRRGFSPDPIEILVKGLSVIT